MRQATIKALCVSLIALGLVSCATDTPVAEAPPLPPPAPEGPPVTLSAVISDAAAIYVDYIDTVNGMGSKFDSPEVIQARLQDGVSYEPKQLARGAVAYAAIVAMQEPGFRSSMRTYAADEATRLEVVRRIYENPAYAATLPGADMAARRVILALSSDGKLVYDKGSSIKQSAYDVQRDKWSRAEVQERPQRLALAKQNSATLKSTRSDGSARLLQSGLSGSGLVSRATTGSTSDANVALVADAQNGQSAVSATNTATVASAQVGAPAAQPVEFDRPDLMNQPYTTVVNDALALAALAMLGEGEAHPDWTLAMLDEGHGSSCFDMSKLNLYQCLAVAKPHFEDVFCLGQHVLMDTGQCLGKMSSPALSFDPVRVFEYDADAEPYIKPKPAAKKKAAAKKKT